MGGGRNRVAVSGKSWRLCIKVISVFYAHGGTLVTKGVVYRVGIKELSVFMSLSFASNRV